MTETVSLIRLKIMRPQLKSLLVVDPFRINWVLYIYLLNVYSLISASSFYVINK